MIAYGPHRLWVATIALLVLGWVGCGSPLVGLECKKGLEECGGRCVHIDDDSRHCGGCGISCDSDEMCVQGACRADLDARAPSDAQTDAARDAEGDADSDADVDADAGLDGGDDGGGDASDGSTGRDVVLPPLCQGPDSPDDCVCDLGQLICDKTCVDGNLDPDHCGDCDTACAPSSFCVQGTCLLQCDPPLVNCGGRCVDTSNNPDFCGGCNIRCASGLCVGGGCLDAVVGHVIVIGHDLSSARVALQRLVGNAIFLPTGSPLRVLLFDQGTTPAAKAGIQSAIASMSAATGRQADQTVASSLAVAFLLGNADVFVIAAQANSSDSVLQKNGAAWSKALESFLKRGGVVVLFDGGGTNMGTYQILQAAGLFDARGRVALSSRTLNLVAPGDAVAGGVPLMYQSEGQTVGFDTDEDTVVVRDPQSDLPVVVHIAR